LHYFSCQLFDPVVCIFFKLFSFESARIDNQDKSQPAMMKRGSFFDNVFDDMFMLKTLGGLEALEAYSIYAKEASRLHRRITELERRTDTELSRSIQQGFSDSMWNGAGFEWFMQSYKRYKEHFPGTSAISFYFTDAVGSLEGRMINAMTEDLNVKKEADFRPIAKLDMGSCLLSTFRKRTMTDEHYETLISILSQTPHGFALFKRENVQKVASHDLDSPLHVLFLKVLVEYPGFMDGFLACFNGNPFYPLETVPEKFMNRLEFLKTHGCSFAELVAKEKKEREEAEAEARDEDVGEEEDDEEREGEKYDAPNLGGDGTVVTTATAVSATAAATSSATDVDMPDCDTVAAAGNTDPETSSVPSTPAIEVPEMTFT
jgi:hypothetical protein